MRTGFFAPGSVVWDVRSGNKYDAIRETIHRTTIFRNIPNLDVLQFTETVVAREREQSTGFGRGIAIAHGRSAIVPTSAVALGISRQGIEYNSFDNLPVHILFVVASHPDHQIDYLRILSSLATLGRSDIFRKEVLSCLCQEEVERKVHTAFNGLFSRVATS